MNRITSFTILSSTLALALALAACGDDGAGTPDPTDAGPLDAAPREVITATRPLLVGQLVEGVMTGGPADRAVIHLEAPVAELDWNIHGHANGGTQVVDEELNQQTVDYVFTPPAQTDWWLLLRNSGTAPMDVSVRVELYGAMTWQWE